jgi:nucleotide-binding universal stress UspA family protein
MLKTILIGLDGSVYSKVATKAAMEIAKNFGCKLYGLGIVDVETIFESSPGVAGSIHYKETADKRQYEEAKKRVSKSLEFFEAACKEAHVECEVRYNEGSPYDEFIKEAPRYDAIMLGQRTFFEQEKREGPCDTLMRILKHTPRPVLVAPEKMRYSLNQPAVVAFDGSKPSARALQLFTMLSFDDSPQNIHLITVCDDEERARTIQERAKFYLSRWYVKPPTCKVAIRKKRHKAILEYAEEVNARIIVMGAYGTSGVKNFFFGSNTRHMLENAGCLLFLYH